MVKQLKYEVGARVIGYRSFLKSAGTVVKTAPVNLLVKWDSGREERVRVENVRPESREDIARREKERALAAWRNARPESQHVNAQSTSFASSTPSGVCIHRQLKTAAEMREAAEELRAMADWFDKKPIAEE